ncbi:hypothetical protein ASF70_07460 [Rhizobium sp. Leaf321]|uniref:hypothetical protein n=1 Tax=Rhizobium sp. Leaf321 TaxID=1736335 RepID=UPI000712DE71|nr:hypothetical protein [Rhizobium sp. Leaf321]KQQ73640.1 hypothetical protein ASF70_07460 [Rhizobium sp. Leaf321]
MHDNRPLQAYFDAGRHMMSISTELELPVAIMVTFLGAAMWGTKQGQTAVPMYLEELAAATGKTPQTISTHLRYLGSRYREGKPGMGLVHTYEHPSNGRCKAFELTPDGEVVAAHLKHLFRRQAGISA